MQYFYTAHLDLSDLNFVIVEGHSYSPDLTEVDFPRPKLVELGFLKLKAFSFFFCELPWPPAPYQEMGNA